MNGGRNTAIMEDSPKQEDNLKIEGNLKKRETKYVDNPEKKSAPKHCAGRTGPL